jgi:hypothetical protein
LIENGDAAIAKNYGELLDEPWFNQEIQGKSVISRYDTVPECTVHAF